MCTDLGFQYGYKINMASFDKNILCSGHFTNILNENVHYICTIISDTYVKDNEMKLPYKKIEKARNAKSKSYISSCG